MWKEAVENMEVDWQERLLQVAPDDDNERTSFAYVATLTLTTIPTTDLYAVLNRLEEVNLHHNQEKVQMVYLLVPHDCETVGLRAKKRQERLERR